MIVRTVVILIGFLSSGCCPIGIDAAPFGSGQRNASDGSVVTSAGSVTEMTTDSGHQDDQQGHSKRYAVAQFDWHHVSTPLTITLWILLATIAKLGFHMAKKIKAVFPDSSFLIVLGLLVGAILFAIGSVENSSFLLDSNVFFLYLLPPIVFDAGYFMPNRAFFDNLGTILTFAVIGTVWNVFAIGLSLWAVSLSGLFSMPTPLLSTMLFSSLISAVDPVAVLVVFEQIHVNEILYIIVFGESLLNDAVTVVLYHLFEGFSHIGEANIQPVDYINGFVSFFVVGLGGVLLGLIWALAVSFTTKYMKHLRVLEPLVVFAMAYASYLSAEMFHLSGILAIVICGMAMKQYVEGNVSNKSQTTIRYFLKMVCSCSETIIFMFLGLSTVSADHHWDTAFVLLTLLFCLVFRGIGVIVQAYFLNKKRLVKLDKVDQFIMAYGGLRGAIAYGLVMALDENLIEAKRMYLTATIVVIYFTVFLQGMTIKPLVNFLNIKKKDQRDKTMNEKITERLLDHLLVSVEDILGHRGHHWIRDKYEKFNNRTLKRFLLRDVPKNNHTLAHAFTKINMREAMDHLARYGSFHSLANAKLDSSSSFGRSASSFTLNGDNGIRGPLDQSENPCLDMNAFNALVGKKLEIDSSIHHLLMQSMHKQRPKSRLGQPLMEQAKSAFEATQRYAEQYQLRRLMTDHKPSKRSRDKHLGDSDDGTRKQVSFQLAEEEVASDMGSRTDNSIDLNNYLSFSIPHIYVEDSDRCNDEASEPEVHQLTAVETELPWKRENPTPPTVKRDFLGPTLVDESRESMDDELDADTLSAYQSRFREADDLPDPNKLDLSMYYFKRPYRESLTPMDEVEEESVEVDDNGVKL